MISFDEFKKIIEKQITFQLKISEVDELFNANLAESDLVEISFYFFDTIVQKFLNDNEPSFEILYDYIGNKSGFTFIENPKVVLNNETIIIDNIETLYSTIEKLNGFNRDY